MMTPSDRRPAISLASATVAFLAVVLLAPLAGAEPIELTIVTGPSIQQVDNRPCIIGDPSCHNPDTFGYTLIGPRQHEGTLSSPGYTVDQIRAIVGGDRFFVGVDLNQAMGHNDGAYTLESFTLTVDGALRFSTSAPTTLFPLNPGNGYSDASIAYFDLTGLSGAQKLVFSATFSGATAGREQFFLLTANGEPGAPPAPAPEPATMLLLGSGLAGVAALRRRRPKPAAARA